MSDSKSDKPSNDLTRRSFLRTGAASTIALNLTKRDAAAAAPSGAINIALVGCGAQGQALIFAIQKKNGGVPVRWIATCDLLANKAAEYAGKVGLDRALGYTKLEEMLKKHPEIDAVFIAVPDWMHAPYTRICHDAGKQVYCEKMMSNSLAAAQDMVHSQRSSGKLLQIGHQRRSNPRYRFVKENIINKLKVCGRLTHAYGQWNRSIALPIHARYSAAQQQAILEQGYKNDFEFLNWRNFEKYGGGPLSDLGAHQIDAFNWMFDCTPRAVTVSGGIDYFKDVALDKKKPDEKITFEHPDNVIAIYEYDVPGNGLVRVVYQVVTTNGSMAAYEKYMGENGTIVLAEVDTYNQVYREKWDTDAAKWESQYFGKGYLKKIPGNVKHKFWERDRSTWYRPDPWLDKEGVVDVRSSTPLDPYELPIVLNVPPHTPHVENFLLAVQKKGTQADLNCPVDEAYKCAVAVLRVNELVLKHGGGQLSFKPEDFIVP